MQQHECEKSLRLWLVEQPDNQLAEPYRLRTKIGPRQGFAVGCGIALGLPPNLPEVMSRVPG